MNRLKANDKEREYVFFPIMDVSYGKYYGLCIYSVKRSTSTQFNQTTSSSLVLTNLELHNVQIVYVVWTIELVLLVFNLYFTVIDY